MNRLYCLECIEERGILITVFEGSRAQGACYLHSIDALGSSVSGYDDTSSYHSPANAADPPAASPNSTATSGPAPAAAGTHASAGNLFLPQWGSYKRTAHSDTVLSLQRGGRGHSAPTGPFACCTLSSFLVIHMLRNSCLFGCRLLKLLSFAF